MSFGLGFLRVRSILSLVNNNAERVTCCLFIQKKWYSPSARDNRQQPNYIRQQVLHTSSVTISTIDTTGM